MPVEIPTEVSNLALWTSVVAFFAPVVLDVIIQSGWSKRWQSVAAFAASAVIGVTSAYFSGAFTGVGVVTGVLLAFVVTITGYRGFWKNIIPGLKDATTITADAAQHDPLVVNVTPEYIDGLNELAEDADRANAEREG